LEFCTKIYCVKVSLVKPTVKSGSGGFVQNLLCHIWIVLQVSTNFGSLHYFLGIKINWKKIKTVAQYWASHSAHGLRRLARWPTLRGWPEGRLGHGLAAPPSGENGLRDPWQRTRADVVTTRRPCALRRGGALAGGSTMA
jgi:hypothetical protein